MNNKTKSLKSWYSIQNIIFLLMMLCIQQSFAALTAEIKPQRINYGDTFNLIITSDEKQRQLPNLKPLQNDFHIVGTERTMSYTVVNGQTQSIQQFIILLMPKKPGTLKLPSLNVGGEKTQAMSIEVSDGSLKPSSSTSQKLDDMSSDTSAEDTIMLKISVNKETFYVGEEIVYSVKLFNSGRLMDAEYQPPKVEDAVLISLGDADRYQTTENGRTYVVEEQRYAIFPQKSGSLIIQGPSFKALVYDSVPRQIQLPSEKTTVNINAVPEQFKDQSWLPARNLILEDDYDQNEKRIEQGETITRTITVKAYGIPAQLIPELDLKDSKDFNAYPEKPDLKNTILQNELVGHAAFKVIYLMNQSGKIKIPALTMKWFNTKTGQTETASLPEKVFDVKPGVQKPIDSPKMPVQLSPGDSSMSKGSSSKPGLNEQKTDRSSFPLAWILALVFAVAWILTLFMFWYRPLHVAGSKRRRAIKEVHEACIKHDPVKARQQLLNWASMRWPDEEFLDLNDITKKITDNKLKKELQKLSQAIYSADSQEKWNGSELWIALASYRRFKPRKKRKNGDLPPINP